MCGAITLAHPPVPVSSINFVSREQLIQVSQLSHKEGQNCAVGACPEASTWMHSLSFIPLYINNAVPNSSIIYLIVETRIGWMHKHQQMVVWHKKMGFFLLCNYFWPFFPCLLTIFTSQNRNTIRNSPKQKGFPSCSQIYLFCCLLWLLFAFSFEDSSFELCLPNHTITRLGPCC